MSVYEYLHSLVARLYKYESVKRLKDDIAVPLRHLLFGKQGFYQAIDIVKDLHAKQGKEVKAVFDIGASVGDKAYVLARAFPRADIFAFEPHPAVFPRLKKRLAPFGNRAHCFNIGFHNTSGELDFYMDGDLDRDASSTGTSSFLPYEKQVRPDTPHKGGVVKAKVERLDDFFARSGVSRISFMKIDVEGLEKEVIEGGKHALARTEAVFVEIVPTRRGVHSREYLDVLEMMHQLGFSLVGVYEDFLFARLDSSAR